MRRGRRRHVNPEPLRAHVGGVRPAEPTLAERMLDDYRSQLGRTRDPEAAARLRRAIDILRGREEDGATLQGGTVSAGRRGEHPLAPPRQRKPER